MDSFGIQKVFDSWAAKNAPGSTLTMVAKDFEAFNTEFPTTEFAGSGTPDLLWAVGDNVVTFASDGLLQPTDTMVNHALFIPAIDNGTLVGGKNYGIPVYAGNHLMLMYNKKFVSKAPETFADLAKVSKDLSEKNSGVADFTPFTYTGTILLDFPDCTWFWSN